MRCTSRVRAPLQARPARREVETFVHISGIGADPKSTSAYIASKGLSEDVTLEAFPDATILRPSVVFGPEDDFFNRFGALSRIMPIIPLFGGGKTRLQPVYVGDVARAAAAALAGNARAGVIYELGGPQVLTLRECAQLALTTVERKSLLVGLPLGPSRVLASLTGFASRATMGLFPSLLTTSRDQVDLLAQDNVVSEKAMAEARILHGLGIEPQAPDAIIESYLVRFRRTGQYEAQRSA